MAELSRLATIGAMAHHRIVPSLVSRLTETGAIMPPRKPRRWIDDIRGEMDNRAAFERFQWLAEVPAKMESNNQPPAREIYSESKPARASRET